MIKTHTVTYEIIKEIRKNKFENNPRILDANAGLGELYDNMLNVYPDAEYTLMTNNKNCAKYLYNRNSNFKLLEGNFYDREFDEKFDLIIIDDQLIHRAIDLLTESGILFVKNKYEDKCKSGVFLYNGIKYFYESITLNTNKIEGENQPKSILIFKKK